MPQTRWKEIADSVRADIVRRRLRPGEKIGSESELAAKWNVSRMTIHRAMHELQNAELVIRKPRIGTVVAEPKAARAIACLFYNSNAYPQANYLRGVSENLPLNHRIVYYDTGDNPNREAELLARARRECDALLWYPTCAPENTPLLAELAESGFPAVCIDRVPAGVAVDAVVTDNYRSSREALRHLTARGHRRIAHLTDTAVYVSSVQERLSAYQDTARECGESPTRLLRLFSTAEGWDFPQLARAVYDALFTLIKSPEPPTAIFCVNDQYMAAALSVCESLNLRVPDDMEIVSFNDSPTLPIRNLDCVHRIVPEITEIGRLASERLNRRFTHEMSSAEVIRVPAKIHYASAETRL